MQILHSKATLPLLAIAVALLPASCKERSEVAGTTTEAADMEAVELDFQEISVVSLMPVPLYDVFDRAKAALAAADRESASDHVEAAASFFDEESETRRGDAREAFVGYGGELHDLATRLKSDSSVTETDLETVFARAHSALALDAADSAVAAGIAGEHQSAAKFIQNAIDHSKKGLKLARTTVSRELAEAGEEAGEIAARLKGGGKVASEKITAATRKARDYAKEAALKISEETKARAAKVASAAGKETEKLKATAEEGVAKAENTTGKILEKTGEALEKAGGKIKETGSNLEKPSPGPIDPGEDR
jgi:hypothetical protein